VARIDGKKWTSVDEERRFERLRSPPFLDSGFWILDRPENPESMTERRNGTVEPGGRGRMTSDDGGENR